MEINKTKINQSKVNQTEVSQNDVINLFTTIWGVGPVEALRLYNNNCYNLEDLTNNLHLLKPHQQIGLKYYKDLLKKIPRESITVYVEKLKKSLENYNQLYNEKILICIAGSYRREKATCGDIDCIVYQNKDFQLLHLIDHFSHDGLLSESLNMGEFKYMGICELCIHIDITESGQNKKETLFCRIDIYKTNYEKLPYALLTHTGNKIFNIKMRQIAKETGYKLSQYGLYPDRDKEIKSVTTKLDRSNMIYVSSEEDIFTILDISYISPKDRDGENIISKFFFV